MTEQELKKRRRDQDDPDVEGHEFVVEDLDADDPERRRRRRANEEPEDDEFSRRKK
jgi:hypothetical protein